MGAPPGWASGAAAAPQRALLDPPPGAAQTPAQPRGQHAQVCTALWRGGALDRGQAAVRWWGRASLQPLVQMVCPTQPQCRAPPHPTPNTHTHTCAHTLTHTHTAPLAPARHSLQGDAEVAQLVLRLLERGELGPEKAAALLRQLLPPDALGQPQVGRVPCSGCQPPAPPSPSPPTKLAGPVRSRRPLLCGARGASLRRPQRVANRRLPHPLTTSGSAAPTPTSDLRLGSMLSQVLLLRLPWQLCGLRCCAGGCSAAAFLDACLGSDPQARMHPTFYACAPAPPRNPPPPPNPQPHIATCSESHAPAAHQLAPSLPMRGSADGLAGGRAGGEAAPHGVQGGVRARCGGLAPLPASPQSEPGPHACPPLCFLLMQPMAGRPASSCPWEPRPTC